jgi:hypoxanthine-DNA glycosylase
MSFLSASGGRRIPISLAGQSGIYPKSGDRRRPSHSSPFDEFHGGIAVEAHIPARKALLLRRHIALWDAALCCEVDGSMDQDIKNVTPTDLSGILSQANIRSVLANGSLAGRLYQRFQQQETGLPCTVLPSTSPANAAWSLDRLCEAWEPFLPAHVTVLSNNDSLLAVQQRG